MIGIEKTGFRVPCDVMNCRKTATWVMGNLSYKHTCINICDDCKAELAKQLAGEMSIEDLTAQLENKPIEKNEQLPTAIEKEIFDCVKVDGRISKADLIAIGEKYGIQLDDTIKIGEMFKLLEGERK